MIHRDDRDGIALLRMEHGKANAVDSELFDALGAHLTALERDPVDAVVLTGSGSIFSAGVNLFRVLEGGPAYLQDFLPTLSGVLRQLFLAPFPIVAAINGHALAGGCIVAAATDHRVMTDEPGAKVGVTELLVGVPFPAFPLEVLRALLAPHHAQELVLTGQPLAAEEALRRGLVDQVVPAAEVLGRARAMARRLGDVPRRAFAITKRQLRQPVLDRIAALQAIDAEVEEAWAAPETHATIRAFLEKNVGKKGS